MEVLYGLHPVEEAVRARPGRLDHVVVARGRADARMERLLALCREQGVRVRTESRGQIDELTGTTTHQGVAAMARARSAASLEDLLAPRMDPALLLLLDGVEDPQNFGALLRTADGAGVHGVVATERRAAPLSATAAKAAAGAAEHIPLARVVNLTRALEQVKAAGIWVLGLDERGTEDYDAWDYRQPCALVLGREGAGLHDLVKRTCDRLLRIPMAGAIASLNVSAAGAVVLFEAARQRRAGQPAAQHPVQAGVKKQKGLGSF